MGDGDGWVRCAQGHRHWGRFGAAGLFLRAGPPATAVRSDGARVVLQHRAPWSHHGGTWGIPGGARERHESAVQGALREAAEEAGVEVGQVLVTGQFLVDHGGWTYTTVLAQAVGPVPVRAMDHESVEVRWVEVAACAGLALHPGLAAAWAVLRTAVPAPVVVVDVANVMGSRPDGWWHDRAAGAARLATDALAWAEAGVGPEVLPGADPRFARVHPELVLVLEGAARGAAVPEHPRLTVVRAAGDGDDAVVAAVAEGTVVVTADRELISRVRDRGGTTVGPRTVLGSRLR